ncbi:hypothetical protein PILCRDRAFT_827886 [Piloderma croceum F 1598]|uniref:Uncharacterized protein n=1 Tax=Piloderma croceum (strain F 1598) TaxID=765440 RepID=A0A0C3EQH7_PILCF|nr:hypothetical protein PILCRDRAFT_827886 [Piloderma croceum F 1598]
MSGLGPLAPSDGSWVVRELHVCSEVSRQSDNIATAKSPCLPTVVCGLYSETEPFPELRNPARSVYC